MTHEEYKAYERIAKIIPTITAGEGEAIIMLMASKIEDSVISTHNGDGSIMIALLRHTIVQILKKMDKEDKNKVKMSIVKGMLEL